jgi:hypothetical protein
MAKQEKFLTCDGNQAAALIAIYSAKPLRFTPSPRVPPYTTDIKQKTRLHHRHIIFERGSSRDCIAKVVINN